MSNHLFNTYENSVMSHGKHIFETAYDMAMVEMCEYPSSKYEISHWKCVLHFCSQFPRIDLPSPE